MSRIDLHPEELLDRELEETISDREQERLETHREQCFACDIERQLIEDFLDDLEPDQEDEALLARALDRLEVDEKTQRAPKRRTFPLIKVAVAAAFMLLAGGSAAGVISVLTTWLDRPAEVGESSEPEVSPAPEEPEVIRPQRRRQPERSIAEEPQVTEEPTVEATEPGNTETETSPRRQEVSAARRPQPVEASAAPTTTASELMLRANQARRGQNYAEAVRLYRELEQRFPGSREEVTSRVSLGRLLLDRGGNPSGALRAFDRYLAALPGGTLAQEALVGRALSLGRLGRTTEEGRTWAQIARRYPSSIHATRARRRLRELGVEADTPTEPPATSRP